MELGDADDPLNAWLWGRRGELFEMQLVGGMPTRSGKHSTRSIQNLWLYNASIDALMYISHRAQNA